MDIIYILIKFPCLITYPHRLQANFTGKVSLSDVRFRYPTRPEVAVLRGIEFSVSPGQTVALVGSSGCGKSTSVSLVERFYEALMGEVVSSSLIFLHCGYRQLSWEFTVIFCYPESHATSPDPCNSTVE